MSGCIYCRKRRPAGLPCYFAAAVSNAQNSYCWGRWLVELACLNTGTCPWSCLRCAETQNGQKQKQRREKASDNASFINILLACLSYGPTEHVYLQRHKSTLPMSSECWHFAFSCLLLTSSDNSRWIRIEELEVVFKHGGDLHLSLVRAWCQEALHHFPHTAQSQQRLAVRGLTVPVLTLIWRAATHGAVCQHPHQHLHGGWRNGKQSIFLADRKAIRLEL